MQDHNYFSIMNRGNLASTVRCNEEVVHKTYCFDFDLSLPRLQKNVDSFHFVQWTLNKAPGDLTPSDCILLGDLAFVSYA